MLRKLRKNMKDELPRIGSIIKLNYHDINTHCSDTKNNLFTVIVSPFMRPSSFGINVGFKAIFTHDPHEYDPRQIFITDRWELVSE